MTRKYGIIVPDYGTSTQGLLKRESIIKNEQTSLAIEIFGSLVCDARVYLEEQGLSVDSFEVQLNLFPFIEEGYIKNYYNQSREFGSVSLEMQDIIFEEYALMTDINIAVKRDNPDLQNNQERFFPPIAGKNNRKCIIIKYNSFIKAIEELGYVIEYDTIRENSQYLDEEWKNKFSLLKIGVEFLTKPKIKVKIKKQDTWCEDLWVDMEFEIPTEKFTYESSPTNSFWDYQAPEEGYVPRGISPVYDEIKDPEKDYY